MQINNRQIYYYSLLAFPLAFIALPIFIYLPQFYYQNYDIKLQEIAIILLICRSFDALQDPILGLLSDKFRNHQKKIILFTAPFLALSFLAVFNPLFAVKYWLFSSLILLYTTYSLLQINYQAFAINLSQDDKIKTKIIARRETLSVLGIIVAAVAPALIAKYYTAKIAFLAIGIIFFFLLIFAALVFYFKLEQVEAKKIVHKSQNFLKTKNLKYFFVIFFTNSLALSIPAALILFFIEIVLKTPEISYFFMLLYFCGLFIGIPLWAWVANKLKNAIKSWIIAIFLSILAFLPCVIVGEKNVFLYSIICLLSGLCFGADYCLSFKILTDIIQKNKIENSQNSIFGITNFITKLCFSLASGILIYLLGYIKDTNIIQVENFLSFSYVLIPCMLKIITALMLIKLSSYENSN